VPAHAPVTPTPNPETATDKRSASSPGWTWREGILTFAVFAYVVYAVFIVAGLWYTGWERLVPPQANSVVLTLGAVTILASLIAVFYHRFGCRRDEQFIILSAQYTALAESVEAARAQRDWVANEPPTVPDLGSRRPRIYQSFAAVYSGQIEALTDTAVKRLETALRARDDLYDERFTEFEERLRDFALLQQAQQGLGRVSRLPTGSR
jgi:hypothetical protein